jgi:G3E family GTPase
MNSKIIEIKSVPTNVITGFLGVGKTSAILHLLKEKPQNEHWAVLVNEFGEIGVDGSILEGQYTEQQGVFIREVPGGCMCCAAGVPMQVALNQLLTRAKPDRLLIEPTGLGHPKEVLQVLSTQHYQKVLLLQKTLTLVDARNLSDERYTTHDTFNQQISVADIIIGNKLDLYQKGDKTKLITYVKKLGKPDAQVAFAKHGEISLSLLAGSTTNLLASFPHKHHQHKSNNKVLASEASIPNSVFIKAINEGQGYISTGWRFSYNTLFNYKKLLSFLTSIEALRIKAVFITDKGSFSYNIADNSTIEEQHNNAVESRIEIIAEQTIDSWEASLIACIVS